MRKILLINKPFQLSLIGWLSFLSAILVLIFYSTIWYFFYSFKKEAIAQGLQEGHVFFAFLNEQKNSIDHIFIYSSIAAILFIYIGGLFLSHKVAGPLHQLTLHLKNHNKENVPALYFRKSDYFIELQEAFNEFLQRKNDA